jgi:hypothetical protein
MVLGIINRALSPSLLVTMLRLSSVSAVLENRLTAVGVLLLGLLWSLLQVLGSMLPLLPRLPVASAGNEP